MEHFAVHISFVEVVEGTRRSFRHKMTVVARDFAHACQVAISDFEELARESSVGWIRTVEGVEIRKPETEPPP